MKRFIRTIAGKTILFVLCLLSAFILAASIGLIALLVSENFYFRTKEDIRTELYDNRIQSQCYDIVDRVNSMRSQENDAASTPYRLPDSDNLYFIVSDENGTLLAVSDHAETLLSKGETADQIVWDQTVTYGFATIKFQEDDGQESYMYELFRLDLPYCDEPDAIYVISASVNTAFPVRDGFYMISKCLDIAYALRFVIYVIAFLALIGMIASFVALMCAASRRPDTEELCPGPLNIIPFDVLTAAMIVLGGIAVLLIADTLEGSALIVISILMVIVLAALVLGYCISIASRLKQRNLLKNTLIYRIIKLVWRVLKWIGRGIRSLHRTNMYILRNIPIIWKTILIAGVISLIEFIILLACEYDYGTLVGFFFLEKLIVLPLLFLVAANLRKLEKGGKAMASGDIEYRTPTAHMLPAFKAHAENLNSVSDAIGIAVSDRMKSEHMKTELITNVSHDIKTPLTSIINYADLISREECDNPKILEYTEVLTRQSTRLKRLIEDLVEASKASTGNLEVDLMPCDAAVFLSQADGEYEEKLEKANLQLVVTQPEKEVRIMADGRRMWRIFDNLMNNICKYSQPGTRVYLSLEEKNGHAVITFRNTSREQLNISEEELMERFTRGDSSRNTEGNGLGLSIARSMAELQNGKLNIMIDGDLFKAVLEFPVVQQ